MLGWSCWCLSTVVSFHMKENQLHKGDTMYGEWLNLHHVLAGKLCYMLGTTFKLSMLFKFWDYSGVHSGWKNTLLKVHWAQQSTSVLSELLRHSPCRVKPTQRDPTWELSCVYGYIPSILCSNARAGSQCLFSPMSTAEECLLSGVPLYDHIYKCCWINWLILI